MSEEERPDEGSHRDDRDGPDPEIESIDERISRVEAIVRGLEAGDVDPEERTRRIAEGKALVAGLERDLEAVEADGDGPEA